MELLEYPRIEGKVRQFPLEIRIDEQWKPIDYNPRYLISNYGRVLDSVNGRYLPIVPNEDRKYPVIAYSPSKIHYLHRQVAFHFVPGYKPSLEVDHINTDKSDCRAVNLQWVTHERNMVNPRTEYRLTQKLYRHA